MNITFEELRKLKHSLPHGSIARIANELNVDEQHVRNFFGAQKFAHDDATDWHYEPGPDGGIINMTDTSIIDKARAILSESV
jgi:hypothetical protein